MSATPDRREEQIVRLLGALDIAFHIHEHVVSRTVADAIEKLPFPVDRYLKTVVFRVKQGPWLLVACWGQDRVDYRKLAAACGVKREQIVRPAPEEVEATLGYEVGGIGPIPPDAGVQALVDATAAATLDTVYCGVGRNDRTLEIAIADLVVAAQARVLPLVQEA